VMDESGPPASHIASSGAEDGEALVEVRGVSKAFAATQALAEAGQPQARARRDPRPAWRERRRQIDPDQQMLKMQDLLGLYIMSRRFRRSSLPEPVDLMEG
jgi:hypothetical protein